MDARRSNLECLDIGWLRTGLHFINGCAEKLAPLISDDYGSFFIILSIKRWLGLDLQGAINLFYYGMISVLFVVGLIGILRTHSIVRAQLVSMLGMIVLLVCIVALFRDVYLLASLSVVAIVPWALLLWRQGAGPVAWGALVIPAGLFCGVANLVRGQSATAVLLFLGVLVVFNKRHRWPAKVLLCVLLLGSYQIPNAGISAMVDQRDQYLRQSYENYVPPTPAHVLWHNIYIGLGFIDNPWGLRYQDRFAISRARELAPEAPWQSVGYERALRNETFRLLASDPKFTFKLITAKLGVLLAYLLIFANIGLLAARAHPKDGTIEGAFWLGLSFSILPGLLVTPSINYVAGFVSFAALYGIFSLTHALENLGAGPLLQAIFRPPPLISSKRDTP